MITGHVVSRCERSSERQNVHKRRWKYEAIETSKNTIVLQIHIQHTWLPASPIIMLSTLPIYNIYRKASCLCTQDISISIFPMPYCLYCNRVSHMNDIHVNIRRPSLIHTSIIILCLVLVYVFFSYYILLAMLLYWSALPLTELLFCRKHGSVDILRIAHTFTLFVNVFNRLAGHKYGKKNRKSKEKIVTIVYFVLKQRYPYVDRRCRPYMYMVYLIHIDVDIQFLFNIKWFDLYLNLSNHIKKMVNASRNYFAWVSVNVHTYYTYTFNNVLDGHISFTNILVILVKNERKKSF